MSTVIRTVRVANESTVVALTRKCEAGSIVSHELLESLGDDQCDELTTRLAKRGFRTTLTDRGLEVALAKSRSGPNLTDAQRAKLGYGRLTLRLPEHTLAQLAALAHERGVTRAQLVAELVERANTRDSHK